MHTVFIVIHVTAMITSLTLMSVAVALGLFGKRLAAVVATGGTIATIVGGATGMTLLFEAPLSVECALLTAYLLAIAAVYIFGFAMGDADRARLIRSSAETN